MVPAPRVSEINQRGLIALPNDEIVRDFIAIIGKKPVRKPKKRPVQKDMDFVFPGSGLGPVILGIYKNRKMPARTAMV